MMLFFRNMMQLMLSPSRGWEDVALSDSDPARLVKEGAVSYTHLTLPTIA